jgi:hypothetical protein
VKLPNIQFGKLIDAYGIPAKVDGWTIVPAIVQLEGSVGSFEFALADHSSNIPPVLRVPIEQMYDAAWVRARIPYAFGFTPEPSEGEKSLIGEGFVAVTLDLKSASPFCCTDYYGKTALMFSASGPPEDIKQAIAHAFWSFLLAEPDELADFSTRVPHLGASIVLEFGCQNGEPYCTEHAD